MTTPEDFLREGGFVRAEELDTQSLIRALLSEMERGLEGEPSSLMMVPTYVGVRGRVAPGSRAAVLDAGGTNFRGAVVEIPPKVLHRENRAMPGAKSEVGEDEFYEAFVSEVRRLEPLTCKGKIGWCFSYPAEATPQLDARLVRWTKNIKAPAIVGQYVGAELLRRLGGGKIAVINDTVATLLAAKATEGDNMYSSYIGFILGTGTNCAYVEDITNIKKLKHGGSFAASDDMMPGPAKMIINAESGNFDKLEQSVFDRSLDQKSVQPGQGRLEKMISGAYLGGIGYEIYKAAAKAGLFSQDAAAALSRITTLETIDFDNFCAVYSMPGRDNVLDKIFEKPDDAKMARRLGLPVFERAAALTAIHLAAFAIKSGAGEDPEAPIAICADGSTWYKTRAIPFADHIRRILDEMLIRRRNIHYTIVPQVDDAPLVGAAIAALL